MNRTPRAARGAQPGPTPPAIGPLDRVPLLLAAPATGLMMGWSAPGSGFNLIGVVAYVPLLLALERLRARADLGGWGRAWRMALLCYAAACPAALVGTDWIAESVHVFGHAPRPVAWAVAGLGYGLEVGAVLFLAWAAPLFLLPRRSPWEAPFRALAALAADWWYPRLFHWTLGGLTFDRVPLLSQAADLVGAWGLGLFAVGANLLVLESLRGADPVHRGARGGPAARPTLVLVGGYALLLAAALGYGAWRLPRVAPPPGAPRLELASMQPNFSLAALASNPDLVPASREANLGALLADSRAALAELDAGAPTAATAEPSSEPSPPAATRLLAWPESVFPYSFYKDDAARAAVSDFARHNRTHILLQSVDWDMVEGDERYYGHTTLVGPDGETLGRYNKIFLIPFGEYMPFAKKYPELRRWMKRHFENTSEFWHGEEHTIYESAEGLRFSGTICFDVFNPSIVRRMARDGADVVLNLANLAWFGRTKASRHMEMMARWLAIENRVPIAVVSNNGESLVIAASGLDASPRVPLFTEGRVAQTFAVGRGTSFYRDHQEWVRAGLLALAALAWLLARRASGWRG